VWWAWEDLNLRLHPYQQSRAHRHATLRFPRSRVTVRGEVMRCSKVCAKSGSGRLARPAEGLAPASIATLLLLSRCHLTCPQPPRAQPNPPPPPRLASPPLNLLAIRRQTPLT